jgi:hypothetical protein
MVLGIENIKSRVIDKRFDILQVFDGHYKFDALLVERLLRNGFDCAGINFGLHSK